MSEMDGYEKSFDGFSRLERLKMLYSKEKCLNSRIQELNEEFGLLYNSSKSTNTLEHKLSSYNKISKIKRERAKLTEDLDNNSRQLKILVIEDLIEKISITLGDSD